MLKMKAPAENRINRPTAAGDRDERGESGEDKEAATKHRVVQEEKSVTARRP